MAISELWATTMSWAVACGARDLADKPGLWTRTTTRTPDLCPIEVSVNASDEYREAIPPQGVRLRRAGDALGTLAILDPYGKNGLILNSLVANENEDGLIAHLKAQPEFLELANAG